MKSISIVGAGVVATTLGCLVRGAGYRVAAIYSRTVSSATRAAEAIGEGRVVGRLRDLPQTDLVLIATSDDAIAAVCDDLAAQADLKDGTIVFHCSGATPSSVLAPLRAKGAKVASVHPVKTFTDAAADAASFAGTWCAAEGDADALAELKAMFGAIGGRVFEVGTEQKVLYHAAAVFMCNYLFSIVEIGMRCYETAGVPRDLAARIVEPILHATVDNCLRLGPGRAITGPIARGDVAVVQRQHAAVGRMGDELALMYELLGGVATELAVQKGVASAESIARIREILKYDGHKGGNER